MTTLVVAQQKTPAREAARDVRALATYDYEKMEMNE